MPVIPGMPVGPVGDGATLLALLLGALLIGWLLWLGRDTPQKRAERAASLRWWRQHREEVRQAWHAREARINELAEAVRRGTRGWW